jgi:hypothetical protein
LWAGGWEKKIKANLNVNLVGGYAPTPYNNGISIAGVEPQDLAGWDSQVMPAEAQFGNLDKPEMVKKYGRVLKNRPELRARLAAEHPEFFVSGGALEGF